MLALSFLLSLVGMVLQLALLPPLPLFPGAPAAALAALRLSWTKALFFALAVGLAADLFSDAPLGTIGASFVGSVIAIYPLRRPLSEDDPLHVSLYTAALSFALFPLEALLFFLFDRRTPYTGEWFFADWAAAPLYNGLYAFIWFALPLALYRWARRRWVIFWLTRNSLNRP
jgi:hypothetical protein